MEFKDIVETCSKIIQSIAIIVGGVWILLVFGIEDRDKERHVNLSNHIIDRGSILKGGDSFDYITIRVDAVNESEDEISLLLTASEVKSISLNEQGRLKPEEIDFDLVGGSVISLHTRLFQGVGETVYRNFHFPNCILQPGEKISDIFTLFLRNKDGIDAIHINTVSRAMPRCQKLLLFFKDCVEVKVRARSKAAGGCGEGTNFDPDEVCFEYSQENEVGEFQAVEPAVLAEERGLVSYFSNIIVPRSPTYNSTVESTGKQ
ncbi:hypothetical protein [Pseudoruegeria sp. HB172150]|uniref:hypothetical protein n=1 Tax=Pseudoruegeria sp. HB172150 TaxID=2721164 RepID=UPI00155249C7|nr:hypothetical protein [Pseudoruegeria sp. HB172150]